MPHDLTDTDTGLAHAIRTQRFVPRNRWGNELLKVPEESRAIADEYLRGIAQRMDFREPIVARRKAQQELSSRR